MIQKATICILAVCMIGWWTTEVYGVEIPCRVAEVGESTVRMTTDSDLMPSVGDRVEVYFQVPGLDEPVTVGTGSVTVVTADVIDAKIDNRKSKLTTKHLARVTSENPRKRSDLSSPPPPPPSNPATPDRSAVQAYRVIATPDGSNFTAADFSADSRAILTLAGDIITFDLQSGEPVNRIRLNTFAEQVAFSANRSRMLTGGRTVDEANSVFLAVWDTSSGQLVQRLNGHTTSFHHVALSRDGRLAASCAGEVDWDAVPPNAAPDELPTHIAQATTDSAVKLWDVESGRLLYELAGHRMPVSNVTFSPNGLFLLTSCSDRTLRLWNTRTGQEAVRYYEDEPLGFSMATLSSDGRYLLSVSDGAPILEASADVPQQVVMRRSGTRRAAENQPANRIRLWDVTEGRVVRDFVGHQISTVAAVISPDGRTVISAGPADTGTTSDFKVNVRIWDAPSGRVLLDSLVSEFSWSDMVFSPDSRYALIAFGNRIRVWQITPESRN